MPLHDSLRERLESAQWRIDSMTLELAEMAKRRQLPFKKIGDAQIAAFAGAVRAEVLNPQSKLAKGYLKALVLEVRVGPTGGVMLGSTADIAAAASNWRESDSTVWVPRHLSNWRARLGSNQQPLPSEGSTLSIELRERSHGF